MNFILCHIIKFYAIKVKVMKSQIELLSEAIVDYMETNDLSQTGLAKLVKIKQYQVARILGGRVKNVTKDVEAICNYANINLNTGITFTCDNVRLAKVLEKAWDGTDASAEFIATILEAAIPFVKSISKQPS